MIHHGQRLAFRLEPRDDGLGVHPELDDLERDASANRFLLLGHVNDATAAFADLLQKFVAANTVARLLGRDQRKTDRPAQSSGNGVRAFEAVARFFAGLNEFFDALSQGSIAGARPIKVCGTLSARQFQRHVEYLNFVVGRLSHRRT